MCVPGQLVRATRWELKPLAAFERNQSSSSILDSTILYILAQHYPANLYWWTNTVGQSSAKSPYKLDVHFSPL